MGDMRSCSTLSSGTKRKCQETNFMKKQKLLNNNIVFDNIIEIKNSSNKGKRRSISLSTNFMNINGFSTCENYLKNKNIIDENLKNYENILRDKRYFSNNEDINKKKISRHLNKNYFNLKTFKKFLFKKSLLYKIRCLSHNSTWLLELSKSKKGKINSRLFFNEKLTQPFPFYKKVMNLFHEKKYKDAYVLLSENSTYYLYSLNEKNILNDNFFEKKSYNWQFMLSSLHAKKNTGLHNKNNRKRNEEINILNKNINIFIIPPLESEKNKKCLFNNIFKEKDEITNNNFVKNSGTIRCFKDKKCSNDTKQKKKKVINSKFINYENFTNNICNIFLQNNYLLPKFPKKKEIKRECNKDINYSINTDKNLVRKYRKHGANQSNISLKEKILNKKEFIFDAIKENINHDKKCTSFNFEEFNKECKIENFLQECKCVYSEKENKQILINLGNCMQKQEEKNNEKIEDCNNKININKNTMNFMYRGKNVYKKGIKRFKEIKDEMEESVKLFIFIKLLSLYLYSISFYQHNKKKKDRSYYFNSEDNYDGNNINYSNKYINIEYIRRKEILIYIITYLKKIKKKN